MRDTWKFNYGSQNMKEKRLRDLTSPPTWTCNQEMSFTKAFSNFQQMCVQKELCQCLKFPTENLWVLSSTWTRNYTQQEISKIAFLFPFIIICHCARQIIFSSPAGFLFTNTANNHDTPFATDENCPKWYYYSKCLVRERER